MPPVVVRLGQKDIDLLSRLVTIVGHADLAPLTKLLDKIKAAQDRKPNGKSISVKDATDAFEAVLGKRLIKLAPGTPLFFAAHKRLAGLGATPMMCTSAAKAAQAQWRSGPIKVESLIRQMDVLLSDAQLELPKSAPNKPLEMDGLD